MTAPHRIQRRRTKGWRMPPNTISVSRPSKWGNPCRSGGGAGVIAYQMWIEQSAAGLVPDEDSGGMFTKSFPAGDLAELRGKNLACWCKLDQACHAELLLEIANR